jgi:hypothetical protein
MASIVLSFVGSQDPYSGTTDKEGSVVALIRHLLDQKYSIRRVFLLYTEDTANNANDTKDWLHSELNLSAKIIEPLPVSEEFSKDPVDLFLAAKEARIGLEKAAAFLGNKDRLEFNASSGTPVMKTAWSLLQAAGYAPQSSVWQVRNPDKLQPGQARVFQTNVDTLKNEFDYKVIEQQINNYNYAGALISLEKSNLSFPLIKALLEYGQYRLAFDFDRAFNSIQPFKDKVEKYLVSEISNLRRKDSLALLKELYFKALIRLKTQQYADFLVDVARFQERFLQFLAEQKLGFEMPESYPDTSVFWDKIKTIDSGKLYQFLADYRLPNNGKFTLQGFPNRPNMMAILEYYRESPSLLKPLKFLNDACDTRNRIIHKIEGISDLDKPEVITRAMREALLEKTEVSKENRFTSLNKIICEELGQYLRG